MKTSARVLKEAYPILLFISLLMSWELTTQGSQNPQQQKHIEACQACTHSQAYSQDTWLALLQRKTRFPWEAVSTANKLKFLATSERR